MVCSLTLVEFAKAPIILLTNARRELTKVLVAGHFEFPGSVDGPWARYVHDPNEHGVGTVKYPRLVPKGDIEAEQLAKRTLTNLYNERPTWLDLAHRKLDEAVFAAYGWETSLSDDEILARLLTLNQERASASSG